MCQERGGAAMRRSARKPRVRRSLVNQITPKRLSFLPQKAALRRRWFRRSGEAGCGASVQATDGLACVLGTNQGYDSSNWLPVPSPHAATPAISPRSRQAAASVARYGGESAAGRQQHVRDGSSASTLSVCQTPTPGWNNDHVPVVADILISSHRCKGAHSIKATRQAGLGRIEWPVPWLPAYLP